MRLPHEFILWDTEFTAWEGSQARQWTGPGEYREIVQIGAIAVEGDALEEAEAFSILVAPVKNPVLSEYFINLTGITEEDIVREGVSFGEALGGFVAFAAGRPCYSYGRDDDVLRENCGWFDVPFPNLSFRNIKDVFKAFGVDADKYSSGTIPKAFGIEPALRAHDALHDARTIAQGLRLLRATAMPQSRPF